MSNVQFTKEVELKSSPKVLFPYFSTADGLQEWFADEVKMLANKHFEFHWDGEISEAKKVSQKTGKYVMFEFLDEQPHSESSRVEFDLEYNDLTGTTFVKVTDHTEEDHQDLEEMWSNMFNSLMEIVGRN